MNAIVSHVSHVSEANSLGKEQHASLPLELVGEEGRLIFTCSLKRWRRLRRTDRVLKHTQERRKNTHELED